MKIITKEEVVKEIEIDLPYYSKNMVGYYMVTSKEEALKVNIGIEGCEEIGWTAVRNAISEGNKPSSKEEFEKAFEETLTIIKNRVYAR